MKQSARFLAFSLLFAHPALHAADGPFDPANWPASADSTKVVHFVTTDDSLAPLGENWIGTGMRILSGGDQVTTPISIGGYPALKVQGAYLNIADMNYSEWADDDTIDILVQVYGDAAVLGANGAPRNFTFLIGTLPSSELSFPVGGSLPVEAKNRKWNWVLFRITNGNRPSDGAHFLGTLSPIAEGGKEAGGVNSGTIRMESVLGLTVRVIAFGERGAFGEPEQINLFAPPDTCDPEPETNLASIDLASGTTNHIAILNSGDQTAVVEDQAGPQGDHRRAVKPGGSYLNFGITEDYLGKACNDPRTIKICLDYYDDPALEGTSFGPEAFATDDRGGVATIPENRRQTIGTSGQWIRRSWTVPAVSLYGVNVTPLTGGPRLVFNGGAVAISRFELAVLRTGNHPLADQDPLADCYEDLKICTEEYGSYVEYDLANGVKDGLGPGSSGGDQVMIEAEAGPVDDRRMAVRPAREDGPAGFRHDYLNFAILNQALGPSTQPNAHLAICVTYYDDPALIGATFRPEVYRTDKNGSETFGFTSTTIAVRLEGTDQWREAYFEVPDVKFSGVNQGPQAATRFQLSNKIFFSRVRYAVIRPCGPKTGFNALEDCKGVRLNYLRNADGTLRLSWKVSAGDYVLEEAPDLLETTTWSTVPDSPGTEGDEFFVILTVPSTRFYRLRN